MYKIKIFRILKRQNIEKSFLKNRLTNKQFYKILKEEEILMVAQRFTTYHQKYGIKSLIFQVN